MGHKQFDRKFGSDLLDGLPASPAVYLFKDAGGDVLYAGKAKDIRRRLRSYRNAGRRKAHRKMRALVREASSLEVRLQPSERDALRAENALIQQHRPRYNVDGAYAFLYPAIGTATRGHQSLLCFTTRVEAYAAFALRWHGVFRSRRRTRDAFDALIALLGRIGHVEPRSRMGDVPGLRGSRLVGVRRIGPLVPALEAFLAGESAALLRDVAARLLEKPDARRDAAAVGEDLRLLDDFFRTDARRLRAALRAAGRRGTFIPQSERDALFF